MYQRQHRGTKKNESRTQYSKRPGRPGESSQLQYKRVPSGKVGGGTYLPPPSPSSSSVSPSLVYRIVKKSSGEGSQSSVPSASAESVSGYVQSDAPTQTSVSETSGAPNFNADVKPINTFDKENVEIATKAQSSHSASATLDTGSPKTPVRFNEKLFQAWQSSKGVEYFPISASKQLHSWEATGQTKDLHPQVSGAPFICSMQSSSFVPLPEVSVSMPYQQPHFPSPQFQHPVLPFSPHQIPLALPGGNNTSPIWHPPPFVPGFQPPQGVMHWGPLFNFPPIHDYQLHSQFGGVGDGVSPPQLVAKSTRNVKITHPETHEELILDEKVDVKWDVGTAGMLSYHPRGDFQPQPFYYGPSHARNYSHMPPNPFLQSPNSQILPGLSTLGQKSSGTCSVAVVVTSPSLLANNSSDIKTLVRPMQPSSKQAESQIHSKFSTKQSSTFVPRPTSSVGLPIPVSCQTIADVVPSHDMNQLKKSSKRAPVHSEQPQYLVSQTLADSSAAIPSEKFEHSKAAVVINTNNEVLKTTKRDDDDIHNLKSLKGSYQSEKYLDIGETNICHVSSVDQSHSSPGSESSNGRDVILSVSESKQPVSAHGSILNPNRSKNAFSKHREKRKENFKDPKKLEFSDSSVSVQSSLCFSTAQLSSGSFEEDATTKKLEKSSKPEGVHHKAKHPEDPTLFYGKKRYSIDYLLTLSSNFIDLPMDFKLATDLVENILCSNAIIPELVKHIPKGSSPSTAHIVERTGGISRLEYRAIGAMDNVRKTKQHAVFASGHEPNNDANQSFNSHGIRPGQRRSSSVVRNLRVHSSNQHASGFSPIQRSSRNDNKWQRASSRSLKGFISSQPPPQFMHRAENKYEVKKVDDAEEGKQRQLKAILNKLTPQNFERLFQQVKEVTIDNAATLAGVISQIFDKALMEPTFCEVYVDFCYHLSSELPDFVEDDQRITFKRMLLNKCQEEFERREREQAEAEKVEWDGGLKRSDQEREEKRIQARRRMLGNIRLIGELYKNKMLTERIMHECIQKLLGRNQNPDEEDIEALCNLMCTIGEMIDHAKAKSQMDTYFAKLSDLANNTNLSSRLRFMLMDVIDLRKNNWHQRRKVEGPKKLEELHRDAHQERQTRTGRFARAPNNIHSPGRGQPPDINNRATTISPTSQMDAFHGMPSHIHGLGSQDVRLDDKHLHESQASPLPLPHMTSNENTIYLGPWSGPTKGMSASGPLMLSCSPNTDMHYGFGETMRIPGGPSGYSPVSGLLPYNASLESFVRPSVYDHSIQQGDMFYARRDAANLNCSFGRPSELSSARLQTHPVASNPFSENFLPEERLAELSISAIREFYSAVDENEVVLCIRELSSPSFLPTMVSLWVNDSFERKDRDRILLSRLLVNLTKSRGILDPGQLIDGFESVFDTLEDAITDAPKAAVFLGSMFGTMIIENVISLEKIGHLIRESSKKPGHLQIGLAREVLENTFEKIKSEKGESFLREISMSSNIELDDFAPSKPPK